jgi:hypothetical protein
VTLKSYRRQSRFCEEHLALQGEPTPLEILQTASVGRLEAFLPADGVVEAAVLIAESIEAYPIHVWAPQK